MSKVILGYLNVRGVRDYFLWKCRFHSHELKRISIWDIYIKNTQPIRFFLEYLGVEYEEKRYYYGPPPKYHLAEWAKDKFNLGLELPNLPYLIDGDVKLTQSFAIMRYFARKYDMMGNKEEPYMMTMLEGVAHDAYYKTVIASHDPEFELNKARFLKEFPTILEPFSKFLDTNLWFTGNISYIDFILFESIWRFRHLDPDCLKMFPNLADFMDRFTNLEQIKKYMSTERYLSIPFNGGFAFFGGCNSPSEGNESEETPSS